MCGRFASTQTDADLVRAFRAEEVVGEQLAPWRAGQIGGGKEPHHAL